MEIRDIRGVMESAKRGMDLFYKYFPQDTINKAYLDAFMPTFNRIEVAVDDWELTMVGLSEEEARAKLNNLRWKAMRVLTQMPPAVEAFYQACDKNVAWCLPNKLPPFRLAAGQLPPRVRKPMQLINDRLNHLAQQVRELGEENQRLLAKNRTLREQAENHDADVQALLHREVSRVKDIHALEDEMRSMRLKAIEQEEYLGIMSLQLEAKEGEMANLN